MLAHGFHRRGSGRRARLRDRRLRHAGAARARHRLGPPRAAAWFPGARSLRYDRRGYGDSGAPEPYVGTTVMEQAEDAVGAAALARAAGRRGGRRRLRRADRAGPRACATLRSSGRSSPPTRRCSRSSPRPTRSSPSSAASLQDSMATGGPDAAVEAWLGGRADAGALARARPSHQGFFADYAGLARGRSRGASCARWRSRSSVVTSPSTPVARRSRRPRRSRRWSRARSAARTATSRPRRGAAEP